MRAPRRRRRLVVAGRSSVLDPTRLPSADRRSHCCRRSGPSKRPTSPANQLLTARAVGDEPALGVGASEPGGSSRSPPASGLSRPARRAASSGPRSDVRGPIARRGPPRSHGSEGLPESVRGVCPDPAGSGRVSLRVRPGELADLLGPAPRTPRVVHVGTRPCEQHPAGGTPAGGAVRPLVRRSRVAEPFPDTHATSTRSWVVHALEPRRAFQQLRAVSRPKPRPGRPVRR